MFLRKSVYNNPDTNNEFVVWEFDDESTIDEYVFISSVDGKLKLCGISTIKNGEESFDKNQEMNEYKSLDYECIIGEEDENYFIKTKNFDKENWFNSIKPFINSGNYSL